MSLTVIWQSKRFKQEHVLSVYARLYSNDEVKLFDVDRRHKTIRECRALACNLSDNERSKLIIGEQVLIRGLTKQQREIEP